MMKSEADKIRDLVNIMEGKSHNTTILSEAPFWDKVKTNTKAAFGNRRAIGTQKRDQLTKKLEDAWYDWLGTTDSHGTLQDLKDFLSTKAGFDTQDTDNIINDATGIGIIPRSNNSGERIEPSLGDSRPTSQAPQDSSPTPDKEQQNKDQDQGASQSNQEEKSEPKVGGNPDVLKSLQEIHNVNSSYKSKNDISDDDADNISLKLEKFMRDFLTNGQTADQEEIKDAVDQIDWSYNYIIKANKSTTNMGDVQAIKVRDFLDKLSEKTGQKYDSNGNIISHPEGTKESRIYEDLTLDTPLSRKEVDKILTRAASYAFKNGLVGNPENNNQRYGSQNGYNQNYGQGNSGRGNGRGSYQNNMGDVDSRMDKTTKEKVMGLAATKAGLSRDDQISLKNEISNYRDYDMVPNDNKEPLARVGWAFLKTL